jgi:Zn-finger nucleic acid-binding protein
MNCHNCGAPLRLSPDKSYFICEHCTTLVFPEPDQQGVRVLEEKSEYHCPLCQEQLAHANVEKSPLHYCPRCRGFLIKRVVFYNLVRELRFQAKANPAPPVPYDPGQLQRQVNCPICQRKMETYPYAGPGNVVIDGCGFCDVLWLDVNELPRIVHAPGKDLGRLWPRLKFTR